MEPYAIKRKPIYSAKNVSANGLESENITPDVLASDKPPHVTFEEKTRFLNDTPSSSPWKPRSASSFPFMGIGALILVILCIAGCLVVLIMSHGKPVSSWSIQPTVLLAIFSAVANTCLAFALVEGVTLSWWNKALTGSTVRDLHLHWKFGTSVWACLTKFGCFNAVALATIMTTLMAIDGPLLQRASTVVSQPVNGPVSIEALIAPEIPNGYTAYIDDRGGGPDRLNAPFVQVMQDYINRKPITSGLGGCVGACSVDVPAAGLAWECSTTTSPINYQEYLSNPDGSQFPAAAFQLWPAFSVSFDWRSGAYASTPSSVGINITYANTTSCSGELVNKICNLTSAVLLYHVTLAENVITLPSSLANLTVVAYANNTFEVETYQTFSTLGGIMLAANDLFSANVTLNWIGQGGFMANGLSTFASAYAGTGPTESTCQYNWTDPTDDIITSLQNIMFRTAVQVPTILTNGTDPYSSVTTTIGTQVTGNTSFPIHQTLQGIDLGSQNVFKTQYAFMGAAAGVVALAVLTVLPLYYNFWQLGRSVSFSPIEIGKAFNSPLLSDPTAVSRNGEVEDLIERIGKRRVRYDFVTVGALNDQYSPRSNGSRGEYELLMVSDG